MRIIIIDVEDEVKINRVRRKRPWLVVTGAGVEPLKIEPIRIRPIRVKPLRRSFI